MVGPGVPVFMEHRALAGHRRNLPRIRYRVALAQLGDPQRGARASTAAAGTHGRLSPHRATDGRHPPRQGVSRAGRRILRLRAPVFRSVRRRRRRPGRRRAWLSRRRCDYPRRPRRHLPRLTRAALPGCRAERARRVRWQPDSADRRSHRLRARAYRGARRRHDDGSVRRGRRPRREHALDPTTAARPAA